MPKEGDQISFLRGGFFILAICVQLSRFVDNGKHDRISENPGREIRSPCAPEQP
jgi:hypothetical protein